ncbi:MFS general substrate transporter [Daldinia bambusicola]|nr:MFS general substrate transporter [Daldinia bambusicola]
MESTITSTSVIAITDDLGGYIKSSWILTAYWLTSGAFQIIWSRLSDIIGRKVAIMTSIFIFTAFSGACGGSQTVFQLIMFRWLQGIGGCGVLALGQLVFFELVPPEKYTAYTALITSVIASSLVTGPLIGGGITLHGEWRWVFLINVPIGVIALAVVAWLFPRPLWNEPVAKEVDTESLRHRLLKHLDILGAILLLGACLLLSTGLQQAALGYSFDSAFVLPLLVVSGVFAVAFFTWQWYNTTRRTEPQPVFPWRFCQSRIRMGIILTSWFSGGVVSTCVFQIPQRFMTANGMSPFDAAARLLAFGAFVPVGSGLTGILLGKLRIRPFLVIGFGAILQVVGAALLSRSSTEYDVHSSQYGFQVIIGIGLGFVMPALIYLLPYTMEKRDLATATATVSQFRILGGLIAVSIGASITTRNISSNLAHVVPPDFLGLILERTEALHLLDGEVARRAREVFGNGYNLQMDLGIGLAAAQIPATLLMWTWQNYSKEELEEKSE